MHPTIEQLKDVITKGDESLIHEFLAEDVRFLPPTYYSTWAGREPVAALLGHVGQVFSDFSYRRIMGEDKDWALEFQCKVGDLDAVGVDLIRLNDEGLIEKFEVVMRPLKTIAALRTEMMARVAKDPRFINFKDALG
ncbi:nuclear transport factor 2 family protein [Ruegeria faecimaris]|uniref:nuclear transport factor 2 family protein n=1 Tax=Ruegeria faecimaris TaxID=686389 RepID=UPI00232D609B|nr:nuclear transport factor 2 family protein [Ruegeria faecimaris]